MARSFNGTNQYIKGVSSGINAFPVTIAGWFYITDNAGADQILMSIGLESARTAVDLRWSQSTNKVMCASRTSTGTVAAAVSTATANLGSWNHCVAAFVSTTSRKLYLNNALNSNASSNDAQPANWDVVAVGSVSILGTWGQFFGGVAAEAAIWDVELTAAEVATLYSGYSPLMVRPSKLQSYWPLHGRLGANANEEDWCGGRVLNNVAGSAVSGHPRIIYPGRGQRVFAPAAAAPSFRAAWVPRASQFIGGR